MIVVFDIETQELVPADRDLSVMRVSIAGALVDGDMRFYREEDMPELFSLLDAADVIVGHNLLGFDFKVLQRYADLLPEPFRVVPRYKDKTFDFLYLLERKTDRRIALNDLAQRNLGSTKLGLGKDAPFLWQDGKIEELKAYLEQDVRIAQQLYNHIAATGSVKYGLIVYKDPVEREVRIDVSERC